MKGKPVGRLNPFSAGFSGDNARERATLETGIGISKRSILWPAPLGAAGGGAHGKMFRPCRGPFCPRQAWSLMRRLSSSISCASCLSSPDSPSILRTA